jgi:DNA-binding NarL/FixJ family response regulator
MAHTIDGWPKFMKAFDEWRKRKVTEGGGKGFFGDWMDARTGCDRQPHGRRYRIVRASRKRQPGVQETEMIQVAVIDDHPLARRGLESILSEAGDIVVTMSAASAAELAAGASPGEVLPGVVLLDLYHGSDEPCLHVISQLRTATKVLVVSASGRSADVLGAIRAGASGYMTKLAEAEMLVSAVRTVAAGGFALSAPLADILQAELVRQEPPADKGSRPGAATGAGLLSPREEQTLDLIAHGFTHSQTATRMNVSKATIDTYVERIRAKLQVGNKAELTRAALQRIPASAGR